MLGELGDYFTVIRVIYVLQSGNAVFEVVDQYARGMGLDVFPDYGVVDGVGLLVVDLLGLG